MASKIQQQFRDEYRKLMNRVRANEKKHGVIIPQSNLPYPIPKRVTKKMIQEVHELRGKQLLSISEIPTTGESTIEPPPAKTMPDHFSRVALDRFYKAIRKYPNSISGDIMYTTVTALEKQIGTQAVAEMIMNMTEQGILDALIYGSKNATYGEKWVDEFMGYLPDMPEEDREAIQNETEAEEYNDFTDVGDLNIPFD